MRAVTSSSNLYRRKLCPGSHHAEAEVIDDGGSAASDEGVLLHPFAIDRKLKRDHLTPKQQKLLEMADRGSDEFMAQARQHFGSFDDTPPTWHNERLPVYGPDREELFTGEADITWAFYPDGLAIQDFKMGFVEVTPAEANYQLASYAISWTDYLDLPNAIVSINQPRHSNKLTTAFYSLPNLEAARREIAAIYHAAMDVNAPRIAGEAQCNFCKAKFDCPEYRQKFRHLAIVPDAKSIATVDNEQLEKLYEAVRFAGMIEQQVSKEMRRRIEDGEIEGWELKPNGETKELVDVVGAYQELQQYFSGIGGFDGEQFTNCMTLSWTKLTALFRKLTGFSEARSRKMLDELLNPFLARKPKNPTPSRIK